MKVVIRTIAVLACLSGFACSETTLRGEGEDCVASSQCQEGLLCDLAADPSVCRPQGSGERDIDGGADVIDAGPVIDGSPGMIDAAPLPIDAGLDAGLDAAM